MHPLVDIGIASGLLVVAALPSFQLPPFHNPVKSPPSRAFVDEPKPTVVLAGTFLFYEDFEHGTARWRWSGGTPQVHWLLLNARTCGGEYTMLMGQPNQAPFTTARGTAWLTLLPPVDLRKAHRPHLTYDIKTQATPDDALTLQPQARAVGGRWRSVGAIARAHYALVFTRFADLTAFVGKRVELRFEVRFRPMASRTTGLYLDNVQIIEPQPPALKGSSGRR